MKYEPVFGDQSLFYCAPEEATHAAKGGVFYKIENMSAKYVSDGIFNGTDVLSVGGNLIAERRIIKEPNRWTWEDKKAGVLPEVGAELIHKTKGICYFVGVGLVENACWALKLQSGLIYIAEKSWCQPIETPAEKAQREEDEFVEELASGVARYDSFINGARAAYRKLKGGE